MAEPSTLDITHAVLRLFSSWALGIGVAASLVVALLIALPRGDRGRIRAPLLLLAAHVVTLLARLPLDAASPLARAVSVLGLFLLLTSIGRALFVLVVDVLLGARRARPMSKIFRDILQVLVYAGVVLITLRAAGVEAGSLLTTSAVLTVVLGLSLQDTLGNLFAGLSIQAQQPFEVGDWIGLDADPKLIGRVVEINWRATKVMTLENVEHTIPNGTLAKTSIKNFTKPSPLSRRTIEVQAPYDASPRRVEEALLGAVHAAAGVRTDPPPFVLTSKFDESGILYQLCFFIDDFAMRDRVDSAVRQRVWFAFQRAGLVIPFPIRTVHMHSVAEGATARGEADQATRQLELLRGVDFLAALPAESLDRLAALSATHHYMLGEVIIRQGAEGHEMFILKAGEVAVLVGRGDGSVAEVARLGPGKFFGEMSLMTGERRSATVQAARDTEVVRVGKDAFHEILKAAPHLAERITKVLIERQIAIEEHLSARSARSRGDADAKSSALLGRIRQFFSI